MADGRSFNVGLEMDNKTAPVESFGICCSKIMTLTPSNDETFKQELNQLIDELNSLDYSVEITDKEEAERLLCHCARMVTHSSELLVTKFCQLIVNIISRQQITPGHECMTVILEYLIGALRQCQSWCLPDVLLALGALLYETSFLIEEYWDCLAGPEGMLVKLGSPGNSNIETRRGALKCLENFTIRCPNQLYIGDVYIQTCFQAFLLALQTPKSADTDEASHCRMLISALRGLQNLIMNSKSIHLPYLGELLAALKTLMFLGLPGQAVQTPRCLFPTPLSQYDIPAAVIAPEEEKPATRSAKLSNTSKKSSKKKRSSQKRDNRAGWQSGEGDMYVDPLSSIWTPTGAVGESKNGTSLSLRPTWAKAVSSESEYSDTEGGQIAILRSIQSKVRHCALLVLLATVKSTERRIIFGYLPAFLPDAPATVGGPQTQTLLTIILKDPSPKVRAGALAVLTALLDGSKQYLSMADDSEKHPLAFTPFSKTVASMIKELHRCLLLSLVAETSPLTLTQLIKCLSTLVINVPYHKFAPGLLTRIVKHLRPFLTHRDSNVRVASLTSLGSVLSIQPSKLEVAQILLEDSSPSNSGINSSASNSLEDLGSSSISKLAVDENQNGKPYPCRSSREVSPNDTEGTMNMWLTFGAIIGASEESMQEPWLVRVCRENILPSTGSFSDDGNTKSIPLPVRLESLQVLAAFARGYFFILRSGLNQIASLVYMCLSNPEPAIQLHGARLFEQISHAMLQELSDSAPSDNTFYPQEYVRISVEEVVSVWLHLLDGPLHIALQDTSHPALRATSCDCLANIGSKAFEILPVEYRIRCIIILLGLTSDEDNNVRAAAVRALGVYVLFSSLKEDVWFLADTANSIITSMEDPNLSIRVKACWALGNLSDTFVLNRDEKNETFMEELSDVLLHKLCTVAISAAQDNDKVKANAVRALGNLLRFMSEKTVAKVNFSEVIQQAVLALVKNVTFGANMKVRWNACYAIGNMFRNQAIAFGKVPWMQDVFLALMNVITECKNFKVRINAVIALTVPVKRETYGTTTQFAELWRNIIIGLNNAQRVSDFTEYKYKENLTEQLCLAFCHLTSLIVLDDLESLHVVLEPQMENLCIFMEKFSKNLSEEKDIWQTARNHICDLRKDISSSLDSSCLDLLLLLFIEQQAD